MKKRSFSFLALIVLAAALFFAGAAVLAIPTVNRITHDAQAESAVASFLAEYHHTDDFLQVKEQLPQRIDEAPEPISTTEAREPIYHELLAAMQAYNEEIYANKQIGLADPWCYTAPVIDLQQYGLNDEAVGVLTISKIGYEEPVYLGATSDHLKRGAAQLSISSMPIGGVNTNCVLAAHRGRYGAEHLRYVDQLELGDTVLLTNLWEILEYEVVEIKVIEPYQSEELLIQDGRDLLTLVTCHPYGGGGRYRYVVYCERVEKEE